MAIAETMPRQEGNQMHTILTGKKGAPKPKAKAETPETAEAVSSERIVRDMAKMARSRS